MYNQFKYTAARPHFHTFAADVSMSYGHAHGVGVQVTISNDV